MSSDRPSSHVVILGGGITGLSAAFHLACKQPDVQITLVEKSARFGGWIRSERVVVHDGDGNQGNVLLEAGPRTIRPNSESVLELVRRVLGSLASPHSSSSHASRIDILAGLAVPGHLHVARLSRRSLQIPTYSSGARTAGPAVEPPLCAHAPPRPPRPQIRLV